MPSDNAPPATTAQPPFDDVDADVVLHTSDHVDFHVFRVVLVLSSPFFRGMFSLPQPCDARDGVAPKPATVDVPEDRLTLESLLRSLYPNTELTSFVDLAHARNVVAAASKYDMSAALGKMASVVQAQYAESRPLEVYFIACQMGWQDTAKAAAKYCLKVEFTGEDALTESGVLDFPGAGIAAYRLQAYRMAVGRAVADMVGNVVSKHEDKLCLPPPSSCKTAKNGISGDCLSDWFSEYSLGLVSMAMMSSTGTVDHDPGFYMPDRKVCRDCNLESMWSVAVLPREIASGVERVCSEVELCFGSKSK